MAHFLVTKSVDAYIKYSAVIEADNELDAVDEAQRNEGQYKWHRSHEVEFDQTEFFQDEVVELTAEEAAIELAHSDENPSSARAQALEEAAKKAEELLVYADTTSRADKVIPAAIRALKSQPAPSPQSLVIIESPYAGDVAVNESYARACLLDCLRRGEAPIASHLLHTQVLDDMQPDERELGIEAGLAWYRVADKCVVYADRGVSGGMVKGIERANQFNVPVEYRTLNERQAAVHSQTLPFTGETL